MLFQKDLKNLRFKHADFLSKDRLSYGGDSGGWWHIMEVVFIGLK
jgi:hypothetical protein